MTATVAERTVFEHRPHLDGLRTIAVYLVVVYHAGVDRLVGGFIGVDLFFVLSGYLVTHVLISDLWSPSGSVSLARFYSRRVRRLLPAAVVTLVATAALFTLVASPLEARDAVGSFRAAFLYVANWHFIDQSTDYFAADLDTNPVLHYWSLSIEEQFYFVWPVALIGLTVLRRRLPRGDAVVRLFVAGLLVASALWALHLAQGDVNRAYYGTDARAYQLLAGALLAMSPALVTERQRVAGRQAATLASGAALAVILVLATSLLDIGPITRGIATTVAAIALLAFLERAPDGSLVKRGLSTDAATYLGTISYGTYLWHWPVVVLLERTLSISPIATAVMTIVVATGLAALSSRLLELPVRRSVTLQRVPRLVAIGGVTMGALVGILVVPSILERDGSGRAASEVSQGPTADVGATDAADVDWLAASKDVMLPLDCIDKPVEECRAVEGSGPTVVLLGDSHGVMMRPTFEEIARRRGYTLYAAAGNGCPWHLGLGREMWTPDKRQLCFDTQKDWYDRIIPEIHPDLVVVVQRALDEPRREIPVIAEGSSSTDQQQLLRDTAKAAIQKIRALGIPLLIIDPIPVTPDFDPIECLSTTDVLAACRYVGDVEPTPLDTYYASQAGEGVTTVNIDDIVCPYFPICDPVVDGMVVKWDPSHLTGTYAKAISAKVEAVLEKAGALP